MSIMRESVKAIPGSRWVAGRLRRALAISQPAPVASVEPLPPRQELVVEAPDEARPVGSLVLPLGAPPIEVETEIDDERLAQLFAHTESTWTRLGDEEPHWSVLSAERFKQDHLDAHRSEFYASGRGDVALFLAFLARNGVAPGGIHRVLEYGCGVGRVTRYLAEQFPAVEACDISTSHLRQAESLIRSAGLSNVDFRCIRSVHDIRGPQDLDAVFSVIVLQHNPPPAMVAILSALLARLRAGGVAYFQVPTHATHYRFQLDEYLRDGLVAQHIEMHCLPQRRIFQLVAEAGCEVLEVREDDWVGRRDVELSNTFLVRKRNP